MRHTIFDGLVYTKLRAVLGGDVRYLVSGGAPLGARLGHFYRGIGINVFVGYWHNDEATREVFDEDGWFHSGDLGELDDAGYLRITGRKKDILITSSGKNVAPMVLEDRLRAHRLVSQCVVVGDRSSGPW